jgi:hypothetical protein
MNIGHRVAGLVVGNDRALGYPHELVAVVAHAGDLMGVPGGLSRPSGVGSPVAAAAATDATKSGSKPGRIPRVPVAKNSNCAFRFGRLLVSGIVALNDRPRTLTGILTGWSRGSGRRSGGQFTSARWRGIN